MAQVNLPADSFVGTGTIARLFGVSEQNIRKLTSTGVLVQIEGQRGKYNLHENAHRYIEQLRTAAAGRNISEEMQQVKLQKLKAETAKATMQARAMQGTLIPADEITNRWIQSARIVRSTLLSVSSRVASRFNLSALAKQGLEDELIAALEDLSDDGLEQTEIQEHREARNADSNQ